MWEALTAIGTIGAVIAALIGYFITWKINKKDRALQQKLFQEEFRPLLTIKQTSAGQNKVIFTITNIGNRAAKDIEISFKAEVTKDANNKSLYANGTRQRVLEENRCLQPTATIEFSWENDCLMDISKNIDIILEYSSLADVKYMEKTLILLKYRFEGR